MSVWVLESDVVPQVNDLVQVTFDRWERPQADPLAPQLSSRVEDVVVDAITGRITHYLVAAPFSVAAGEPPSAATPMFLRWATERGVGRLPVSFTEVVSTGQGPRLWLLTVAGRAYREQRRRFFRVPVSLAATLRVRSDVVASPTGKPWAPSGDVCAATQVLPEVIHLQASDLSEGGMLCTSIGHVLPDRIPVTCTFTLEDHDFAVNARVIWSVGERSHGLLHVKTALSFEHAARQADLLRALIFRQQRRVARERPA